MGDTGTKRAVHLAGGWMHEPGPAVDCLADLLGARGVGCGTVDQPDDVCRTLDGPCDLLVVSACWFSMSDARYTETQRRDWAVGPDAGRERAIMNAVDGGARVLALHTAVICFDGWSWWRDLLGGGWNWDTSWHPEPASLDVVAADDAPFGSFEVVDEHYQGLDVVPSADVLARYQGPGGSPAVWEHTAAGHSSATSLLGHGTASFSNPSHRAMLGTLVDRLLS